MFKEGKESSDKEEIRTKNLESEYHSLLFTLTPTPT